VDSSDIGAPVDASTGTATLSVPTWGWPNGTRNVTAVDCAAADATSCNTASPASTSFDLENNAPQVTAPVDGARITGGFTITATSPGGGVRFLIDSTRRGFDNTAPYTFTYTGSALSAGRHAISVVQCSSDETRCDGPASAPVTITSDSLHPSIVSITPAVFSPNGDRVKDTTTVTYDLPDNESVSVSVSNARGTVVRSGRLGNLSRGRHTWVWNGRSNSNAVAPSGSYRVTVSTTATHIGVLVKGLVSRSVVLDNRAPYVSSLSGASTVYPYRDGYRDTMPVTFGVNERATTVLTIRNAARHVVLTLTSVHNPGRVTLTWNGRSANGRMVPSGAYSWQVKLTDAVGNHGLTRVHWVTVSAKRLYTKNATIFRNGDSYTTAGGSDPSCAEADPSLSDYPHGVWLANTCLYGNGDVAAAYYRVTVPAATIYSHFTVQVYGFSVAPPSSMTTGFGVHGGGNDFGLGGQYEIETSRTAWYTVGSVNAANYVSNTHSALIAVAVTDYDSPCDFDIKQVQIHLTYKVLG
jgi:flagellar hook assembly protein FlgD